MIEHDNGLVSIETEEEMRQLVRDVLVKLAPSFDDLPLQVALNVISILIRSTLSQVPIDRGVTVWANYLKGAVDDAVDRGIERQTGGGMDSPLDAGPKGVLH